MFGQVAAPHRDQVLRVNIGNSKVAPQLANRHDPCANCESRPPFKFVAPVCAGTGVVVDFPWSKGVDYDPDSIQYAPDFALDAASFGLQEFLKLLEFRD